MKVLIIGSTGFIGYHLKKYLESENYGIICHTREEHGSIEEISSHPELFRAVDIVFHLASTTHDYHVLNDESNIDALTNIVGTQEVLKMVKNHCPKAKVVYTSSCFTNHGEPRGLQGTSKLCAEHYCKIYHNVFGLNTVIARLSNVYGEHEPNANLKKDAFNKIIKMMCDNEKINLYSTHYVRDFIHVDDVCSALEILARKGNGGNTYDVCTGKSVPISFVFETAEEASCTSSEINNVDPPQFHVDSGIGDWRGDPNPLRSLGWKPLYDVELGIKNLVKYCQEVD